MGVCAEVDGECGPGADRDGARRGGVAKRGFDDAQRHSTVVRGEEQESSRGEQADRAPQECIEIGLNGEGATGAGRAGEGGRIEDDEVEGALLATGATVIIKDIRANERSIFEGEVVRFEVSLAPFERSPGNVDAHDRIGGAKGSGDGVRAGVGEHIQDRTTGGKIANAASIVAMVEEQADGESIEGTDDESLPVFVHMELGRGRISKPRSRVAMQCIEVFGRGGAILGEYLKVSGARATKLGESAANSLGPLQWDSQPALMDLCHENVGELLDHEAIEAVRRAVQQAKGAEVRLIEQSGAGTEGVCEERIEGRHERESISGKRRVRRPSRQVLTVGLC